jgi:hypothetical protein
MMVLEVVAQYPDELLQQKEAGSGKITIHAEEGVAFLLHTHIQMNERSKFVDGYRIQLYSGSGPKAKQEALKVKGQVLDLFPDERVHIAYNAPFWRVRIGDYRHKHEALVLWNDLKKEFPSCYIVKDGQINMENL